MDLGIPGCTQKYQAEHRPWPSRFLHPTAATITPSLHVCIETLFGPSAKLTAARSVGDCWLAETGMNQRKLKMHSFPPET